jgi:hypothetical protein
MKTRIVVVGFVAALVIAVALWVEHSVVPNPAPEEPFTASLERGKVVAVTDYQFSEPFLHDNLTIYLIHGESTLPEGTYLTLQEALEQNKVVVHETESVGQLALENISDEPVYVQSGDIVKGGKQDRTFPADFIAPPHSGQMPIDSFCVEHGRWAQRGKEAAFCFSSSEYSLAGKSLKFAVKADVGRGGRHGSQGEVWRSVGLLQDRLSARLGEPVASTESRSSLELTLENSRVREAIAPYIEELRSIPDDKADVIGVAVVVNGNVRSADIYASNALFRKLWPKLLAGSAVEALIEQKPETSIPLDAEAVRAFLLAAESGPAVSESVTQRVFVLVQENEGRLLSDTCDRGHDNLVIHRNILAR